MMGGYEGGFVGPNGPMAPTTGFSAPGGTTYGTFVGQPPPPPPGTSQAAQSASNQTAQILDGIAKLEQLRTIQTGIFHYSATSATGFHQTTPGAPRNGSITVQIDIDFGNRSVGGGNSRLVVQTTGTGNISATLPITSHSFLTGTGDAIFTESGAGGLTGTFTVKNGGGIIGNLLKTDAVFNGSGKQGTGTLDNIPRTDGASSP